MEKKYLALIAPHTHWDREWYSPFQVFRRRLVRLVDRVLELLDTNEDYPCFSLDGQTVVLEDYLEVRPENEEKIRSYVREGRLLIGPWYVLPDEFLVSGEALVRNLMRGHRVAGKFGRVMRVGYEPDAFGHVGQLPQILAGFGLDNVMFTRGATADPVCDKALFVWKAAGGTEALAIHQVKGYGNFAELPKDDEGVVRHAQEAIAALEPHLTGRILLLNAGTDHQEADPRMPRLIRLLSERIPDVEFRHVNYDEAVEALRGEREGLPVYRGELRGGRFHPFLPGVYSMRMPIKQKNAACEAALERCAEPLAAMAWQTTGYDYPRSLLGIAWVFVMKNHPHDSICGCSIDEVVDEMMPRFEQCLQIADGVAHGSMMSMSAPPAAGEIRLRIFNSAGAERTDVCRVLLPTASLGSGDAPFVVEFGNGEVRAAQVRPAPPTRVSGAVDWTEMEMSQVVFTAEVSPFGYRDCVLRRMKPGENIEAGVKAEGTTIENEYLKLTMRPDGTLDVTDKRTERTFEGLAYLEDEGDGGDEYDFSPLDEGRPIRTKNRKALITMTESGAAAATLRAEMAMPLPEAIRLDRKGRSARKTPCPVCVEATVAAGMPRIDLKVTFGNRVKDHRLRMVFETGLKASATAAESAFEVVERPVKFEPHPEWDQPNQPTQPQQTFVDVSDGERGLAIINRGLPEYEARSGRKGTTLNLTLLRCAEWMSRPDLKTRRGDCGPMVFTPGGQSQGDHEFNISILPHAGDWRSGNTIHEAHAFSSPLLVMATGHFYGRDAFLAPCGHPLGIVFRGADEAEGNGKSEKEFCLAKPDAETVVTALKKAEDEDALVLRFWRMRGGVSRFEFCSRIASAQVVDLNEAPLANGKTPRIDGARLEVEAGEFEIVTLKVRLE